MKQRHNVLLIPSLMIIVAMSVQLSACGAKGDLVLPDLKQEMKQKNQSNPNQ